MISSMDVFLLISSRALVIFDGLCSS